MHTTNPKLVLIYKYVYLYFELVFTVQLRSQRFSQQI